MQAVFVDVPFDSDFLVFHTCPVLWAKVYAAEEYDLSSSDENVRILAYLLSRYCALKALLIFPVSHVRMAERSKAPDSRVELFLTGVFWSTNVGVGSNPTSDKRFSEVVNELRNRAL